MSSIATTSPARVWDLKPGNVFRGRTIATIQGVIGLASNPVAVLTFTTEDKHPVYISAVHSDLVQSCDSVRLRARAWVRHHGLREGDAVDIELLRAEVLLGYS